MAPFSCTRRLTRRNEKQAVEEILGLEFVARCEVIRTPDRNVSANVQRVSCAVKVEPSARQGVSVSSLIVDTLIRNRVIWFFVQSMRE